MPGATTSQQGAHAKPATKHDGAHVLTIHHLMATDVVSCRPSDSLNRAAQLMWDHDIGAVPVVDEESKLVGILTDRDIAMAAYLRGRALSEITVESTMTRDVRTLGPGDSPHQAAMVMRHHLVRRLPIVDKGGMLVGILSLNDIARAYEPGRHGQIEADEVSETLRAICTPRKVKPESVTA
jgi:CBS domain-containing protein